MAQPSPITSQLRAERTVQPKPGNDNGLRDVRSIWKKLSDRNDGRAIARMLRVNLSHPLHGKTLTSHKRRARPTARVQQEKALAIATDLHGLLRKFSLKVGAVTFEAGIRELVEENVDLSEIVELVYARQKLRVNISTQHRKRQIVRDEVCRRLTRVPRRSSCLGAGLFSDDRHSLTVQELNIGGSDPGADAHSRPPARQPPHRL